MDGLDGYDGYDGSGWMDMDGDGCMQASLGIVSRSLTPSTKRVINHSPEGILPSSVALPDHLSLQSEPERGGGGGGIIIIIIIWKEMFALFAIRFINHLQEVLCVINSWLVRSWGPPLPRPPSVRASINS